MSPSSSPWFLVVLGIAFVSLGVVGCDSEDTTAPTDDDDTVDCDDGPLPVGETPPAPTADCDEVSPVILAMIEGQVQEMLDLADETRDELLDPDTVTVVVCGTGTPIPSSRAESCTAVFANGQFLLFDAGDGALRSMTALNLPMADLEALFLTHYHSDHVADVGAVVSNHWILGGGGPLPLYGGEGISRIVGGFNRLYALDETYRRAHHGEAIFPEGTEGASQHLIEDVAPTGTVVYEHDGVTVTAFPVDHSPVDPTLGYRVDYGGRSIAITSDTLLTEGLTHLCDGADVVIGDAMSKDAVEAIECVMADLGDERNSTIMKDIRSYHLDVTEMAEVAQSAGVDTLVLTHQVPSADDDVLMDFLFTTPVSEVFDGELIVAVDGDRVSMAVE